MNTITKPLKKELSAQFYRGNRAMLVLAVFAALGKGSLNLILSWVLQQLIDAASGLPEALPLPQLAKITVGFVVLCGIVLAAICFRAAIYCARHAAVQGFCI